MTVLIVLFAVRWTGWTQREAIESLIRKAGYRDRITDALLDSIALTRYQSSKCKLSYDEYVALRQPFQN